MNCEMITVVILTNSVNMSLILKIAFSEVLLQPQNIYS